MFAMHKDKELLSCIILPWQVPLYLYQQYEDM